MKAPTRETRLRRLLWSTALLPVLLALGASLLLAQLVENLLNYAGWVDHTDQVIAQARACKEIGLRMQSVVLSPSRENRPRTLENFVNLSAQIQTKFNELQRLVTDNPGQAERAQNVRGTFKRWSERAREVLETHAEQPADLPSALDLNDADFEKFASSLDQFIQVEEQLRTGRNDKLEVMDRNVRRWRTLILVSGGVLLSLVLWRQLESIRRIFHDSEMAVSERAEVLETTLASIGDAVLSTDERGRITFLNAAAEKSTGWSSAEAQGKPLDEVFTVYDERTHEVIRDPAISVLQEGRIVVLPNETLLRVRDGRELSIAASASPIRHRSGKIFGLVLVFRDTTEERRAQRVQSQLAAIVRYSDDAIIGKDLEGKVTAWNEGAERMFGYLAEEMLGKPITSLFPEELRQEEPAILEAIQRGDRVDHYETVRATKAGRRIPVSSSISPIFDEKGRVTGASSILRDITRLREDREALRRARDELEQRVAERTLDLTAANERLKELDRFRSEFLAAMSHELRTPLNSIIGFTEILKEGRAGTISEKQAQYLGMAHGSAKHLLNLINDLLDLSRIESGKDKVFPEVFEVETVIREALQTVQMAAQQKHLKLEMEIGFSEPILSDRKKVYQIVLNLLANAVKFTDRGEVRVEAGHQDGDLEVSVSDTGIGMTQEQLKALFGQFRRMENPGRRIYEGAGLGLYLCKKLVTLMGGEIWAESERGKGSRFTFRIPAEKITLAHAETESIAG